MGIVKDIEAVKAVVMVYGNVFFDQIDPYVDDVEREYAIPILGKELYNSLAEQDVYKDDELKLFKELAKAIVPLALHVAAPKMDIGISAGGFVVNKSEKLAPAAEWRVRELKKHLRDTGHNRLDALMEFLADNKDSFETLDQSAVLGKPSYLLPDAKTFTTYVRHLKKNRFIFMQMWPMLTNVEENVVKDLLGESLYDDLIADIKDTEREEANLVKLIPYCQKVLAHYTFAESLMPLGMELTDNGLSVFNNNYAEVVSVQLPADDSKVSLLEDYHRQKGEDAVDKLLKFLHKNIANYASFKESDHYSEEDDGTDSPTKVEDVNGAVDGGFVF